MHDAYGYFITRYDLSFAGAVKLGDATDPSPRRLDALRQQVAEEGVVCAFTEPQYNDRLLRTATEGEAVTIAQLDPLGRDIPLGADHYEQVIKAMSDSFGSCLSR